MMTLAKLTERLATVSRRTVQLWADEGVLVPMKGTGPGTDVPRLFDEAELRIAKVLREMLYSRTGTSALLSIAKNLRGNAKALAALERADRGESAWLALAVAQDTAFEPECQAVIVGDDVQTVANRVAPLMAGCDVRLIDLKGRLYGEGKRGADD